MYPHPGEIEHYARRNGTLPLIMCEYAHAMGNSLGGFGEYWRVIRRHHGPLQGGFIWDWKDQGIASRTMDDRPMWAFGGDFGPPGTPSDGIFCANGLTQPDGKLNPHAVEVAHVYSPLRVMPAPGSLGLERATLRLRSELLFSPLTLTVSWAVLENGVPRCNRTLPTKLVVPPRGGSPVRLMLDLSAHGSCAVAAKPGREYHLNLDARTAVASPALPRGHRIRAVQFLLHKPIDAAAATPATTTTTAAAEAAATTAAAATAAARNAAAAASSAAAPPSSEAPRLVLESPRGMLRLSSGRLVLSFNRSTGALMQFQWDGKQLLQTELRPNFWRAPIDNDLGWQVRPRPLAPRQFVPPLAPRPSGLFLWRDGVCSVSHLRHLSLSLLSL
jgi:beta-galactosidase